MSGKYNLKKYEERKRELAIRAAKGMDYGFTPEEDYKFDRDYEDVYPEGCEEIGGTWVASYRKKDGTEVKSYCRRP